MYAKSTRPSAKREVQKERSAKRDVQKSRSAQRDDRVLRSAKRDDRIARPRRAQTCERSELRAMRMCPRSGQIFLLYFIEKNVYIIKPEFLGSFRLLKRVDSLPYSQTT